VKKPLQLRLMGVPPIEGLEEAVRDKAVKLEKFAELMSCRVTIELLDKHKHLGRHYAVRIEVTLPGETLNVGHVRDEDVQVALRDAFDDMRRQIQDSTRRAQEEEKARTARSLGDV